MAAEQATRGRRGRPPPTASVVPLRGKARQRHRGSPDTRKPGVKALGLPAGLSGSVTKASWSAWVRIGKLVVSGCGEGKRLPSIGRWLVGCHVSVSTTRTGPCQPMPEYLGRLHCRRGRRHAPVTNFNPAPTGHCVPQSTKPCARGAVAGLEMRAPKARAVTICKTCLIRKIEFQFQLSVLTGYVTGS